MNPLSPLDRQLAITLFRDRFALTKSTATESLRALAARIRTTTASAKANLPWLKLAEFGDVQSAKGSLRHDDNVLVIEGVEGDYDALAVTPTEAVARLAAADLAGMVYTSPSYAPDRPKWRVLCPVSEPLVPSRRRELTARLNGALGGILSGESFALSQAYYFGSVASNPHHDVWLVEGRYIDLADDLVSQAKEPPRIKIPPIVASTGGTPTEAAARRLDAACGLFTTYLSMGRHQVLLAATRDVAPFVLSDDLSPEDACAAISAAMSASGRDPWDGEVEAALHGAKVPPHETPADATEDFGADPSPGDTAMPDLLILDRDTPLDSARQLIRRHHWHIDGRTLHRHAGQFWRWSGTRFEAVADDEMRSAAYRFLDGARRQAAGGMLEPFHPVTHTVSEFLDALKAEAQLAAVARVPAWIGKSQPDAPNPADVLACANGLLHLPTRVLLPHTPRFFSPFALGYPFDPDAPAPRLWLRFLGQLWPDDPESILALQELFGLLLTADTRYQKMFLLIGPRRSGKGTIARVLNALLGSDNICSPTMNSLTMNFGMQPLIGKLLAVIGDARLGSKADTQVMAERLLSISGEDSITIDRKYAEPWTGQLSTRVLVLSNELPRFSDASGALASRFIILRLRESFLGREDQDLTGRLLAELPGVLLWSLAGLASLRARGRLIQPVTAQQEIDALEEMASPITAFVHARCVIGPDEQVPCGDLYAAWCAWCRDQGRTQPGTASIFSRDLHAAFAGIETARPMWPDGTRGRAFRGVSLAPHSGLNEANKSDDILTGLTS